MANVDTVITVEVAYAAPSGAHISTVTLERHEKVRDAIDKSNLLKKFPEIDLAGNRVGIFSRFCALNDRPADGDRIEIYRQLLRNPREIRRRRSKGNVRK